MPTNPNGNAKAVMLTLQAFRDMLRAGRPSTPQAPLLVPADRPAVASVGPTTPTAGRTHHDS